MSDEVLYKNLMLLGGGIEACLESRHAGPALILLYSAIDTSGWLDSDQASATRSTFIDWVDRYLLRAKSLSCNALDLYAARCGLLHTFTPDSSLSTSGKARRACYAWGGAKAEDIQRTIDVAGLTSHYFALHLNDLYDAWRLGLREFIQELDSDPARKSRVHAKAAQFFTDMGTDTFRDFLDSH